MFTSNDKEVKVGDVVVYAAGQQVLCQVEGFGTGRNGNIHLRTLGVWGGEIGAKLVCKNGRTWLLYGLDMTVEEWLEKEIED